ncbi:MAG: GTPase [Elainellaceae cyanobacterium]
MVRLSRWQWAVLIAPIALAVGVVLVAAGWQLQHWGISWVWAIIILVLVAWRWLLVWWTRPTDTVSTGSLTEETPAALENESEAVREVLAQTLAAAQADPPLWEDWGLFAQRCQSLVTAIAHLYHPDAQYPMLNIYVPQAYGLIRGTVDDVDRWMQQLSPVLGKVTVGQAYQGYRFYQKLEPSARQLGRALGWLRWITNPAAAVARQASQPYNQRANQELLGNLSQMLRDVALRNLAQQAAMLYGKSDRIGGDIALAGADATSDLSGESSPASVALKQQTATLQDILSRAEPIEQIDRSPLSIWIMGRTGAGKSSLINSLFQMERAEVDLLPNTADVHSYRWQTPQGDLLQLWDTPGYEQANQPDSEVIFAATNLDILLLATPAVDPALQMDSDRLADLLQGELQSEPPPAIAVVTQVDRLRPVREWSPPYDWQMGDRPKEQSIRAAMAYRAQQLPQCQWVVPVVTRGDQREAWNMDALSDRLLQVASPAKQLRLARVLNSRQAQATASAQLIQRCSNRMATTQGLTALLKSPILGYISTLSTGSPALAQVLAQQIPVEQLPLVIGKLQLAYDLFSLLGDGEQRFDLMSLWPVLIDVSGSPQDNAWALGQSLVEYWTRGGSVDLKARFQHYRSDAARAGQ